MKLILVVLGVFVLAGALASSLLMEVKRDLSNLKKDVLSLQYESDYAVNRETVGDLANQVKRLTKELEERVRIRDIQISGLQRQLDDQLVFGGLSGGITPSSNFRVNSYDWSPNNPSTPTSTFYTINTLESTGLGMGTSSYWNVAIGTTTAVHSEGVSALVVYGTTTIQTPVNSVRAFQIKNSASSSVLQFDTLNLGLGIGTSSPAIGPGISVESTGTSTIYITSQTSNRGGCIQIEGPASTTFRLYATTTNTVAVWEAGSCR